ncbi:MAG TPA: DUF6293 family protein [Thermoflexus sp.]|nr:DUF6293 family protein [Thermoflexus sp.]
MGVYHLMGLGRSPGVVIGPITYLAHRYQRWSVADQGFFARSGEVRQRAAGQKVGDIEALVLFTTREVLRGQVTSYPYIDNPGGRKTGGPQCEGGSMRKILRDLLRQEWPAICTDRRSGTVFWCEVDRRDIRITYRRIVQVIAALAGAGGQGKEIWINLTGGNNVINAALMLAAALSGDVARIYYVQAEDEVAEKCVRFTAEDGYWVELPVMPLSFDLLQRAIIDLLEAHGPLSLRDLHSRLQSEYWHLSQELTSKETLRRVYLAPLWKGGIVIEAQPEVYALGPQWELIRPYQEELEEARSHRRTIQELSEAEEWIEQEEIVF